MCLRRRAPIGIESVLAAAVKSRRVHDFIEVLDGKAWKDAWRPIYEALRATETGSAEYLKRIAIEVRTPALEILRRIAPDLRKMPMEQDEYARPCRWCGRRVRGDGLAQKSRAHSEENGLSGSSLKVSAQIEVLSLVGDVALEDDKPAVHAHLIIGRRDGTAHGGHLLEARVRTTPEVVLTESSKSFRKVKDPQSALAVIQP